MGSRFTHPAESRYASIEGEALAVADTLDKTRCFILRCSNLIIAIDHKPLLKIFTDRTLDKIPNNRLRNLKERTFRYKFTMMHIPGVKQRAADATSSRPTGATNPNEQFGGDISVVNNSEVDETDTTQHFRDIYRSFLCGILSIPTTAEQTLESTLRLEYISSLDNVTTVTWNDVRTATAKDNDFNELTQCIKNGMPDHSNMLPPNLRQYYQLRASLSVVDGVIIYNERIIVPVSLREFIIQSLHASHHGTSSMIARAEASIYWPGITSDISEVRNRCQYCNRNVPSQPNAPPVMPIPPVYPFQCICADYFLHKGVNYPVIVDRYSNWLIISQSSEGAKGLTKSLKDIFTTYGISAELSSDGGPEFTASVTKAF